LGDNPRYDTRHKMKKAERNSRRDHYQCGKKKFDKGTKGGNKKISLKLG